MIGLSQCAVGLPLILVWLVGGTMLGMRLKRNRAAAGLGIGGIALAVVDMIFSVATSAIVPFMIGQNISTQEMGVIFSGLGILRAIIAAISWGLVLAGLIMALGKPDAPEGLGSDRG
jgi:hypothetical protein